MFLKYIKSFKNYYNYIVLEYELVQNGVIQMLVVGNPVVESFNKDFAVIGLPYLYDSLEHQKKVFLSGVLDPLFESTASSGFEVIGAFTAGARCLYTDKPMTKPEDLKGYKFRVMQSDTMKKMVDYMGGVGTPMEQGEVYTAVQQGVIEGGENNEVTYVDLKHYEIAPYFSYTNHLMVPDLIIINEDLYKGMTPENRKIFDDLMHKTIENEFKIWNENVEAAKKIAGVKPLVGIGLGHQVIALALGGKIDKLPFGHRGASVPVKNMETGRVLITTQHHGFNVAEMPENTEVTYTSLNDGSIEGLKHKELPIMSVQFIPAFTSTDDKECVYGKFLAL